MTEPEPDPWRCATCGTRHAVPSMARLCEATHQPDPEEQQ